MTKKNEPESDRGAEEPTEFEKFEALAKGLLQFKKPAPETPPKPNKGPRKKQD